MPGRKKRARERGCRMPAEAFPFIEEALDHELAMRAGTTTPDPARFAVVPMVERLLAICDGDPHALIAVFATWWERYDEREDERATTAAALYLEVALKGIGNLFVGVPDDAPIYDAGLAAEGRARGWRP